MLRKEYFLLLSIGLATGFAQAEGLKVQMNAIDSTGVGKEIGTIEVSPSLYGTIFTPNLIDLKPGLHGFHMHQNPNCAPAEKDGKMTAGAAAGDHYDPENTGRHAGPYGNGHLGDLPTLYIDENGKATHPVLAPRIELSDVQNHSLMIHSGGDNYSDHPELGGGGSRIACGVTEQASDSMATGRLETRG